MNISKSIVFTLNAGSADAARGGGGATSIQPLPNISKQAWSEVHSLLGLKATNYLRLRYGSEQTYLLTAEIGGRLAHVQWIVPAKKIRSRYNFVDDDSCAIISCATAAACRGRGLYPRSLAAVSASGISRKYFIWADEANEASLRGIEKAGAVAIGEFTRVRKLFGVISSLSYEAY